MTYGDSTRVVHAGLPPTTPGQPILPGPSLASTFPLDPSGPIAGHDTYGRTDSATRRRLEQAIGELEGGDCLVFATGMAAVSAALLTLVRDGDHVMLPADGYYLTRTWANQAWARAASDHVVAHGRAVSRLRRGPAGAAGVAGQPGLDVCDIAVWPRPRTRPARWSRSTTPPPPRSARPRSRSAPTSSWPAAPRR
jgi:cystathionine gamma-lyase